MDELIVCAANRKSGAIVLGIRHCDMLMHHQVGEAMSDYTEQGFVTNKFRFVDRQEAWKIASRANQIRRRVGGDDADGGTLYSENLY